MFTIDAWAILLLLGVLDHIWYVTYVTLNAIQPQTALVAGFATISN